MTDVWNRLAIDVPHPFSSPLSINKNASYPLMLKARRESRLLQIAVECPNVRQLVHFMAAGTEVSKTSVDAS